MKIFLLITASILAVIVLLTCLSVGFLFEKNSLKKIRLAIILINIISIGICIFNEQINDVFTVIFMTQLICVILTFLAVMIRFVYQKIKKPLMFSQSRRKFLKYGMFYPLISLATASYGNQIERNETVENFYDIPINNLPEKLNGFKIAQISDIHLGKFYSLDKLKELLNQTVESKSDLLAITGDIFDDVTINNQAIKLVDSYCDKFKYGIWYCHGNHEHHRGIKPIEEGLKQTKIHWLVNQSQLVTENLCIVGVDYPMNGPMMKSKDENEQQRFNEMKKEFLIEAMKNVPQDSICILLAHHPEFIDNAVEFKILLTLTGHTHGSQFGFLGIPLFPAFKYTRGMFKNDDFYGYVHVGNGSWFPLRIGCPPEIAYFTLKNKI